MIKKAEEKGVKLLLPVDHVEGKEFSNDTERKVVDVIDAGWSGFDIGPKTIALYKAALEGAKTVVWNGPMGVFEFSNFAEVTGRNNRNRRRRFRKRCEETWLR